MINFKTLRDDGGFEAPKPGFYKAKIDKAEMRTSSKTGEPYLSFQLRIRNHQDKPCGVVFDMLMDPTGKSVGLQTKMKRFVIAVGLQALENFELKDLLKLIPGRELVVDITVKPDQNGNDRGQVDVFKRGGYLPMEKWPECYAKDGGTLDTTDLPEEPPFILPDDAKAPKAPQKLPEPTAIPEDEF